MDLPSNIDSKFRYILIAAKRARQLQSGGRPLVQSPSKKATKIAQQEVSAGLIPIENIEIKSDNGNQGK
ncbi:MAG: DNA-directed RNA polymerase subunit omega [Acidobacteria bacterium]|nr:DNA-directed RNA polymerase subunit omega [Acidobacteriota bacterium]